MKKIITIGSCLSINTAHSLEKHFIDYKRISSTQHCRIDFLFDTYFSKSNHMFDDSLILKKSEKIEYADLILFNQSNPGFAGIKKSSDLQHIKDTIDEGNIDILIMDNFQDIVFKLFKYKNNIQFLNKHYFNTEHLDLQDYLSIDDIIDYYSYMIDYVCLKNPQIQIFIINFPMTQSSSDNVKKRSQEFYEKLKLNSDSIHILTNIDIYPHDLSKQSDYSHFTNDIYMKYAAKIHGFLSPKDSIEKVLLISNNSLLREKLTNNNMEIVQHLQNQRIDQLVETQLFKSRKIPNLTPEKKLNFISLQLEKISMKGIDTVIIDNAFILRNKLHFKHDNSESVFLYSDQIKEDISDFSIEKDFLNHKKYAMYIKELLYYCYSFGIKHFIVISNIYSNQNDDINHNSLLYDKVINNPHIQKIRFYEKQSYNDFINELNGYLNQ